MVHANTSLMNFLQSLSAMLAEELRVDALPFVYPATCKGLALDISGYAVRKSINGHVVAIADYNTRTFYCGAWNVNRQIFETYYTETFEEYKLGLKQLTA